MMPKLTTEYFHPEVPKKVIQKLQLFILALKERVDVYADCLETDEFEIVPIEGLARDGYIPFQQGGYELNTFATSETILSAGHRRSLNNYNEEIEVAMRDCEDDSEEQDALSCDLNNLSVMITYEVFVKDGVVTLRYGVNHEDEPYFREKHCEYITTTDYPINAFLNEPIKDMVNMLTLELSTRLPY
jgi:hypothetical protein